MLRRPRLEHVHRLFGNGLRIDRNERLRPAERHGGGAIIFKHAHQQIPGNGAVLVDADLQPGERAVRQKGDVPGKEQRLGLGHHRCGIRRFLRKARFRFACAFQDRRLVVLADLAIGPVELDAIAVGRDVRAGDHQGCRLELQAEKGERRRRHRAAIARIESCPLQRSGADRGDFGTGGTEVAADQHRIARLHQTGLQQVARESIRIECRGAAHEFF